jgi:two-component system cell cycle sensor histidine kinase/response regulator CckA
MTARASQGAAGDILRVLIIEDSATDAKLVVHELRRGGRPVEFEQVQEAGPMEEALARSPWDVVVSDWSMPKFSALDALACVDRQGLDIPFIIVSGTIGEDVAVEAIRAGAHDFMPKHNLTRLAPAIERELRERRGREARRKAEAAFRASEERYRRIVETTNEGVWTIDAESKTTFVNARMAAMLGYEVTEVIGRPVFDFLVADAKEATKRNLDRRREGLAGQAEVALSRKDGSEIWVLLDSTPIRDDTGRFEGVLAMVMDLTERRQAEQALRESEAQLRQSQKMEAIGSLAGGVAHDFNNLLTVILSYAEVIASDLKATDPLLHDVQEIQKAGQRAAALTRQLLLFSRQQVAEPKVIDLNEVLLGMDKLLRRIIGEDIELSSVPPPDLGRVLADPGHIEQVIMNLVVNARDAMPKGGKLTIETANAVLDEDYVRTHLGSRAGPHVMLAVTDTGTGMDKAVQSRIFEPFFTTKEMGKGTGLGLSTVFGIVKQSNGSIWVYSEPGKGTTFKVYLPRTDAETEALKPGAPRTNVRGTETVLLVEDEDAVRRVARGILERQGYQVMEARNAGEALLICEKHAETIHLLLTDVVMPQMSGPEVAKRLMQTRPGMKVLCVSGYTDETVVRHGILEAGIAFLQKPYTPDALLRKVREVLAS